MSHFASMKTQITDRSALVTGLQNLLNNHGIPGIVEVHETPMILENAYDHDAEAQYANVILRRSHLNSDHREALLDIGFLKSENGTFELIADDWDMQRNAIGREIGPCKAFLNAVQTQYNIAIVRQMMSAHLWDYSEIQQLEDGSQRLVLTQRPVEVVVL